MASSPTAGNASHKVEKASGAGAAPDTPLVESNVPIGVTSWNITRSGENVVQGQVRATSTDL